MFCPLCGQAGYLLFENQKDRLFGASGKWNTMQCQSDLCKLLWLNPMPNKEDIGKAYANYYTHLTGRTNILPFLYPIENGLFISQIWLFA